MKTFINKKTEITGLNGIDKEQKNLGYANLALFGLANPPKAGFTIEDMKRRLKVMDKLENLQLDETVELEDAELDTIIDTSTIPWLIIHKDIVAYDAYLKNLHNED